MIELTQKEREFLISEIVSSEEWGGRSKVEKMIREHELEQDLQDFHTLVGWLENINYRRKNVYGKE